MGLELTPDMVKMIVSIGIVIVLYLLAGLIVRIINKKISNLKTRHSARKTTLYVTTLVVIAIIALIWIQNLRTVSVVISVIGAGLVVALQEPILSIAGWLLILTRRPFETGDRIEVGGVKGDVIDVRMFQTSLLEIGNWVKEDQSTGRVVHIPNSLIFKGQVYNYTKGFDFIWNEIKINVTFESNWKKAEEIMLKHAKKEAEKISSQVGGLIRKMSEQYLIYYEKLTPIVYVKVIDFGVELSLRYLTEAKMRRRTQDELCRIILDEFGKQRDVNFAYPTYRLVR